MKGYTSVKKIENYILTDINASFETQVEEWIEQIELYIDKTTGRNFLAGATATAKKYDGDGTDKLIIDDAVSVTKVEIGSDVDGWDEIDSDDIYQYPANATPKTKIEIEGTFPKSRQNVRITGKWGYSIAVPADIGFVAAVLVSGIINFSNQAEGEVQSKSIGSFSVSYKNEKQWVDFDRVETILKYYKKFNF